MPNMIASHNALLRADIRKDMRDGYQAWPKEWDKIIRDSKMETPEILLTTNSGLPEQQVLGEGEPYLIMDTRQADVIRKKDTQYGLGCGISIELKERDRYNKAMQSSKWLTRSTMLTQENAVADLLDDAFTGATFTGMFGERLCHTAHTLLGSPSTWSNQVSGNPQLSVAGLQAAFELGENAVDQMGAPMPVKIDTLIINIADQWMAIQLTQNPDEPNNTDRNINALRRKKQLSYEISHYKDQSGRDWFARDTSLHDAHLAFYTAPSPDDWYDNSTRQFFFVSRQSFCVYFYDQRGWIGSDAT